MDTIRSTTVKNSAVSQGHLIIHATVAASSIPDSSTTPPIWEGMLYCLNRAVHLSYTLHNRFNGSTVSLLHGSMVGKRLFSVSIYPSRTVTYWERPSREDLFDFAKTNLNCLIRPGHALGTWYDDRECVHVLDIVYCTPHRRAALKLGMRFRQSAIFDLEARREIPILPLHKETEMD